MGLEVPLNKYRAFKKRINAELMLTQQKYAFFRILNRYTILPLLLKQQILVLKIHIFHLLDFGGILVCHYYGTNEHFLKVSACYLFF